MPLVADPTACQDTTQIPPVAPQPTRKPLSRKITPADVEAIAKLIVSRRLTETESCIHLGIRPEAWFHWKQMNKHHAQNEQVITRVRAAHVDSLISSIDEMGSPEAGKKRDWRAKAWQAERMFPERFGQAQQSAPAQASMPTTVNVWIEAAYAASKPAIDVQAVEVKALHDKPLEDDPACMI